MLSSQVGLLTQTMETELLPPKKEQSSCRGLEGKALCKRKDGEEGQGLCSPTATSSGLSVLACSSLLFVEFFQAPSEKYLETANKQLNWTQI